MRVRGSPAGGDNRARRMSTVAERKGEGEAPKEEKATERRGCNWEERGTRMKG